MNGDFENIKVGDLVIYISGGWYSRKILAEVTKVTPKQFVAGIEHFRKSDGAMIGNTSQRCRLATEDDIRQHKEEQYRNSLRREVRDFFVSNHAISNLSNSQLEAIIKIIKPTAQ